jgi:hypothetical protein
MNETKVFVTRWVISQGIKEVIVLPAEDGKATYLERPLIVFEPHEWHINEEAAIAKAIEVIEAERTGKNKQISLFNATITQLRNRQAILQAIHPMRQHV